VPLKKGLGRGFDSLIPTELIDESLDPTAAQDESVSDLREIALDRIEPDPDQPRRTFDEQALEELAQSIIQYGIVQPIVVTPIGDRFQIVAGERRYRAAGKAGLRTVPALVRSVDAQNKLELSLIENIQRRDLNILETATAYLKLRDQFNLSLEEIGRRVGGKSVSTISNTLRLLRLPDSVKQALQDGQLSEGQARPLVTADPEVIEQVLPQILREEWSARRIERFVVALKQEKKPVEKTAKAVTHHETVGSHLAERFAAKVNIRSTAKGSGQIVIAFRNDDDFERITQLLEK